MIQIRINLAASGLLCCCLTEMPPKRGELTASWRGQTVTQSFVARDGDSLPKRSQELNTKESKQITLNLAGEFSRATSPIVGGKGVGPPSAYAISLNPGEVTVLSLDAEATKVCETPGN